MIINGLASENGTPITRLEIKKTPFGQSEKKLFKKMALSRVYLHIDSNTCVKRFTRS